MPVDPLQNLVIRRMNALGDWLDKYEYLIGLGDRLPPMDPSLRTEDRLINGCQTQVWIDARLVDGRMRFQGDCDAKITRGVLALILSLVDGRTPAHVAKMEMYCLQETRLMDSLSPSRLGGVGAMIQRLHEIAVSLCD